MNRMLMLSGAVVLAFATVGTAQAGTQILDCYNANGKVISCAADYGPAERVPAAARQAQPLHQFHQGNTRSDVAAEEEQIEVVGIRPDWDVTPAEVYGVASSRPGTGGDWVPVVATSTEDKMQQWQSEFLGGEGLSGKLHF